MATSGACVIFPPRIGAGKEPIRERRLLDSELESFVAGKSRNWRRFSCELQIKAVHENLFPSSTRKRGICVGRKIPRLRVKLGFSTSTFDAAHRNAAISLLLRQKITFFDQSHPNGPIPVCHHSFPVEQTQPCYRRRQR